MAAERNARDTSPDPLRERLALALDVDDLVAATRLAASSGPGSGWPRSASSCSRRPAPTPCWRWPARATRSSSTSSCTTSRPPSAGRPRSLGALGVSYLDHARRREGPRCCAPASTAWPKAPAEPGWTRPSPWPSPSSPARPDASATLLAGRVAAAVEAGCGGVVCAASDAADVKALAPRLLAVVPGIRLRAAPSTTRPGRPRPPKPSPRAPTCWSSAGPSRPPPTPQAAAALVASLG